MTTSSPSISVVVATHNDRPRLQACLASLARQDYSRAATQIIVVDDGSTDDTARAVRRDHPEILLICKHNAGAELARNDGVDAASGDVVAFIDSDCVAPSDWLSQIANRLCLDSCLVVGGRILHPGGFWQRLTGIADFGEFQGHREREVRSLPTCNMALHRTLFQQVRFDPRFAPNADTLLSEGLARRGARLVYDPSIMVLHHPAADMRSFLARAERYGRSFVMARRLEPGLRHAWVVRAGAPGVVAATLGRTVLDWYRLLLHRRRAGFRVVELPAALAMLAVRRVASLPAAVRALCDELPQH